jgi:hypothetical protein
MSDLRWQAILTTSSSGILFGALTIFAWISGYEQWVALIIIAGIGKVMAYVVHDTPVRHAFVAGFLAGLLAVWTQAAFLPLYFENNPSYQFIEVPFGLGARMYTVLVAPIGGLIAGTLACAIAWPVSIVIRLWRKTAANLSN